MSKSKALKYTILWTGLAVVLLFFQVPIWPVSFLGLAAISGIIWFCLYLRDEGIVAKAKIEQAQDEARVIAPPMASKGSDRLFVPPPLDRRSSKFN